MGFRHRFFKMQINNDNEESESLRHVIIQIILALLMMGVAILFYLLGARII